MGRASCRTLRRTPLENTRGAVLLRATLATFDCAGLGPRAASFGESPGISIHRKYLSRCPRRAQKSRRYQADVPSFYISPMTVRGAALASVSPCASLCEILTFYLF